MDGNLASVSFPGETLSFAYDGDGLMLSASNTVGVVSNEYDAATGWLMASRGADGTEVSYSRRSGGSVASITSAAGATSYAFDAAGRRTHIESPSGSFALGYCDWNGKLAAVTNANGFVVQYAYDIMDRVTNISWKTTLGASLGGFAYEYDAFGRITSRSHTLGGAAFDRVYAYDDLDRLASDGGVAYTYDAAGNRMMRTEDGETVTYTLGQGDRLASWTGGAYTHDAAGNVTRIERDGRPTLDLAWNSRYQLVSVSTNGVFAESYAYDALGRRVATTTLEGTTRHVYDDNWQVIADIDESDNVLVSYTWGDGIDNLLAVNVGGATYYPLTDIQGTVWGYVDSQNNVVARWQYDAWGNVLSEYVAPSATALASVRYRFQGREWSAATGLINFRMRWYDAETGRWLSKDPIGLSGGLNLYAFCVNDAVDLIDPFGTSGLLLGLRPGPSLLLENGPKMMPRPLPAPKSQPIPRLSPALKNWRPGRPMPDGFRPPPNPNGNWYNPDTGESLFDDMGHSDPIGPHFDLTDGLGHHFRWFPNGRIVPKIPNLPPVPTNTTPQPSKDESGGDAVTNKLLV